MFRIVCLLLVAFFLVVLALVLVLIFVGLLLFLFLALLFLILLLDSGNLFLQLLLPLCLSSSLIDDWLAEAGLLEVRRAHIEEVLRYKYVRRMTQVATDADENGSLHGVTCLEKRHQVQLHSIINTTLTRLSGVTSTLVLLLKHISQAFDAVSATFLCVYMLGNDAMAVVCACSPEIRGHFHALFGARDDEHDMSLKLGTA